MVVIDGILYAIIQSSPVIEAKSKTGKKYWQGHIVRSPSNAYFTCTSSWKDTKAGTSKVVWSTPYFAEPKNIGKVNETSNVEQARSEFDSMVQKERDKREAARPLPMTAKTFMDILNPKKSAKKHIVYPAYVQPKFDGMRMLYDGETAWSRGNKDIIPEVVQHLHFDTQGHIIDGELILPDNPKVNEVMKAVKKYRPGISDKLVYRVYDIVDPRMPFEARYRLLHNIVASSLNLNILLTETRVVNNEAEVLHWHENFTATGFEGTMVRNMAGLYDIDRRSYDLQKYKDFIDAEFLIVDVIPSGGGSSADMGKFVCVDEKGNTFESTATGSEEERRYYLSHKDEFIGKWAKIKYRELSGANQVPFHSNVLEIRETKTGGY